MSKFDDELKNMPAGLDRAILRVLSYHTGRDQAIGRNDLVHDVGRLGVQVTERQLREEIKQLRRQGHLICSAAGETGGYFFAVSRMEFDAFVDQEYLAKIRDMSETLKAMEASAVREFGYAQAGQPALF
jgi:hypothetical protein